MDHRADAIRTGLDYLRKHDALPVARMTQSPPWIQHLSQLMASGAISGRGVDHITILMDVYISTIMAGVGGLTDNVGAIQWACAMSDDIITAYLRHFERQLAQHNPPFGIAAQQTALVKQCIAANCSLPQYPASLEKALGFAFQQMHQFEHRTNGRSRAIAPFDASHGLPVKQVLMVGAALDELDITDSFPQFQHFFARCTGSFRRGITFDPLVLAHMRTLHRNKQTPQTFAAQLGLVMEGNFAPRPTHDYATAGAYILVSMFGVGGLDATLFARVQFDSRTAYPEWESFALHIGADNERGMALTGTQALAAIVRLPVVFPTASRNEVELWSAAELPTWIEFQHGWQRRHGIEVTPNGYRGIDLQPYLDNRD